MIISKQNRRVIYENLFKGVSSAIQLMNWFFADFLCYVRGRSRGKEGL